MIKKGLCISVIACLAWTVEKSVVGTYVIKRKDFKDSLALHKDSTFSRHYQVVDADSKYKGKWHQVSKNTLLLIRDSASLVDQLSSGYMPITKQKVIIISETKIKLGNSVLIKISE